MRNAEPVLSVLRDNHVIVTGEPAAGKLARRVRRRVTGKRTCTSGTSPRGLSCAGLLEAQSPAMQLSIHRKDV